MKNIVITGSTRGIGLGLADAFLARGCRVMISGRRPEVAEAAAAGLASRHGADRVFAAACDVSDFDQVQHLWDAAQSRMGSVDIWINNAGQGNMLVDFWELDPAVMRSVVGTNVLGTMYGIKVAVSGMIRQGHGDVYNMEGFGSRGSRKQPGLTLYGSTKHAIAFLTDSLALELKGKPVRFGSILPGMVVTDMLLNQRAGRPEDWEQSKRAFNILADRVETVAPWIADQVLAAKASGRHIRWLNGGKLMLRFLAAPFTKRQVIDDYEPREQP